MRTIEWKDGTVFTVDQTKLPHEHRIIEMRNLDQVAEAIRNMRMRGAPLLGAAAAFGLALTVYHSKSTKMEDLIEELEKAEESLKGTRPTAVNLFWAINRIMQSIREFSGTNDELVKFVVEEAKEIADEDVRVNHLIGKYGAELINDGDTILTHCNAGALATVDYGTALGVVRSAWKQNKNIKVVATETRPKFQGARLTTYELKRDGIPVTLITDNMVGYVMYKRMIDKVIVGADRIVRDAVINKIGTASIAIIAKEHKIPFYVAAPKSTFDLEHTSKDVIIEERSPEEVTHIGSLKISTSGVIAFNPAFDITPLEYVEAIICEDGTLKVENMLN